MLVSEKVRESLSQIDTCPGCGGDWYQMGKWLKEPLVWEMWPSGVGGTFFRSQNHQKALDLIQKCTLCQIRFKEEK